MDNNGSRDVYNEDFNIMTTPSNNIIEVDNDVNNSDNLIDNSSSDNHENENFDVFGTSNVEKKSINKKMLLIIIGVVVLILVTIGIVLLVNNRYTVKTKSMVIKIEQQEAIEISASSSVMKKITCQSSDEEIASVDDDCNVLGQTVGTTTIYVGINGKKSKKVTVKVESNKEELTLKETNINVDKGSTYQLEIDNVLDDDVFTWSSANENIATVNEIGLVTGIHVGTTSITVTESDGRSISTKVTVNASDEVLIQKITIDAQTIAIGEEITLTPTITPSNGLKILTWKSSKESVATVDSNGKVTGVSAGTTTITVTTHNGKKATAKITVDDTIPASIKISNCTGGVVIGTPVTLGVTYSPTSATSNITWTSSDTSIATVSNGKVTGKASGTVTITATTSNDKKATCKLTVSPTAITALSVSPTSVTLDQGGTKTISTTISPSSAKSYYTISYKSSNTSVATVDSNGKITAVGAGNATITVNAGEKSAKVDVTVNATEVTKVTISGCDTSTYYKVGNTLTLSATASPTTAKNASIKWKSSDTSIASVSSGKVTFKGKGTATITAYTSNGTQATCKVNVIGPDITKFTASSTSVTITAGNYKDITFTTNLSSSVFNNYYSVSCTSSNTSVATVSFPTSGSTLKVRITGKESGVATVACKTVDGDASWHSVTISVKVS